MSDPFRQVEKHLRQLERLNFQLNGTSDPYSRKTFAKELKREAEAAGKAVKKYLEQNGDPQKIADFYKLAHHGDNPKD